MKVIFQVFCVACIYLVCITHAFADSTNFLQVTVGLQDGSRIIGKSSDVKFKFNSEILGGMKLPLEQIRLIEFQPKTNAVKLTVVNGDKLSVTLETKEIHIETSFGNVKIPADSIRRLQISTAGNFGGTRVGLVALWSGEGNANDSIAGCNGQLINDVSFVPGKVGQAFSLNENFFNSPARFGEIDRAVFPDRKLMNYGGGYILIPASAALDVGKGDGFTFECWIKPKTVSNVYELVEYERALSTSDGRDVGMLFAIHNTLPDGSLGSCLYANILDTESTAHIIVSPANLLIAGSWQHIALTYDKASGVAVLYINGTVVKQANLGSFTPQTSFGNLLIGGRTTYGSVSNPNTLFSGEIDEFGIYNRALSAAEIQSLCTEQNNGQPLPSPSGSQTLSSFSP